MVQGLLEGDKDSSPSVQNDRVGAIGHKANWRERKKCTVGRQPCQRWPTACHRTPVQRRRPAPAAFLLAQFRERKSRAPFAGIAFLRRPRAGVRRSRTAASAKDAKAPTGARRFFVGAIPRAQKSATFAGIAFLRRPRAGVRRSRTAASAKDAKAPTGARSGPPSRSRRATARLARAQKSA